MAHVFQVQEAKNRFSELIDLALSEGPQIVTRHGKPVVKIVPAADGLSQTSKTQTASLLSLRGTGTKLWGTSPAQTINSLRSEWE
jgi:prevent-host-death family protein